MDRLARAIAQGENAASLEATIDHLRPLFSDIGWLDALLDGHVRAMATDPLYLPPFRASRSGPLRHMVLARTERLWMTVTIIDPLPPGAPPPRIHFSGRYTLCRPLGEVPLKVETWARAGEGAVPIGEHAHRPGTVVHHDERDFAWRIKPGEHPVMLLRAQIAPPGPVTATVHDPASGALLATSSGDERHARALMMLSLLRLQGRGDATDCFEEAIRAPLPHQRWAAMREYLALDTAAALPALKAMATGDGDGELRDLATVTLAQATALCRA